MKMTAKGVMNKGKVYIVMEGGTTTGSVDSVWDSAIAAYDRRDLVRKQGYLAEVIVRRVR
jgi:hypothetical protein